MLLGAALFLMSFAITAASHAESKVFRGHGLAMHGDLKYPAGFKHFDYVNPNAPKGGEVRLGTIGGYDSFNPFVIKGRSAAADHARLRHADGVVRRRTVCDVLPALQDGRDAGGPVLGRRLLSDPKARWHDGKTVTVDDVIWSFDTLFEKGAPFYRFYYGNVSKVEKLGANGVKFSFKPGENRELPLILGQLVVLPKHYWESRDFSKATLEPPLGSGPYRVDDFEAGRTVAYGA